MEFEIKDGVPIPRGVGKPVKYDIPLADMKKGQSIEIPMAKSKIAQDVKIIRNYCLRFTHKNPSFKFTVRQLDNGGYMEIINDMLIVERQLDKAKKLLKESQDMVKNMQNTVFCMEAEVIELRKEFELQSSRLESEVH